MSPGLSSGLLSHHRPWAPPQVLSVPPYSHWPHLRPCPALAAPSAPAGPPHSPSSARHPPGPGRPLHPLGQASTLPGRPPRHCLPPASARSPDTHYSLSSTMSLRGSAAAACCQPGFPPASRQQLSLWPCPARLPARLRLGLFRPRRSRRGRCAGSCAPASPPPAPLPTPPAALVPQRRAGAGRLCGNQRVTRSVRADLTRGRGLLALWPPGLKRAAASASTVGSGRAQDPAARRSRRGGVGQGLRCDSSAAGADAPVCLGSGWIEI